MPLSEGPDWAEAEKNFRKMQHQAREMADHLKRYELMDAHVVAYRRYWHKKLMQWMRDNEVLVLTALISGRLK